MNRSEEVGTHPSVLGRPLGRLTPRVEQGTEDPIGYQMTCYLHDGCNKSVSNSVSGDANMSRSMLMLWLLHGRSAEVVDKVAHRGLWQRAFQDMQKPDAPSIESLRASLRSHDAPLKALTLW